SVEIEVAGLEVKGDEVIELGLESPGVNDLEGLEQSKRQPPGRAFLGAEHHVAGGCRCPGSEPVGVGYPGSSEHGDKGDLDSATRLDPDPAARQDAALQTSGQRRRARVQ